MRQPISRTPHSDSYGSNGRSQSWPIPARDADILADWTVVSISLVSQQLEILSLCFLVSAVRDGHELKKFTLTDLKHPTEIRN